MAHLPELLRLLGDETRLRILHLLLVEPLTVGELQDLLDLSQSSVSGHLSKLKRAGFIHSHAEGSSHRYQLREDLDPEEGRAWQAIRQLSADDRAISGDRERLQELVAARNRSWVDRVAGSLHRAYAPGRTWESLSHGFLCFADLGVCLDIGAGDGAMIELLAHRASELICVDPSPAMVAAGQARIADLGVSGVRYLATTAEAIDLPDASCDSVLFLQSLQYVDDPAAALAEAQRLLRPGGRLLILTLLAHDHDESERYGHQHRGFAEGDLRSWLTGMEAIEAYPLAPESRPPRFQSLVVHGRRRA